MGASLSQQSGPSSQENSNLATMSYAERTLSEKCLSQRLLSDA
jgi:hypothetical protein